MPERSDRRERSKGLEQKQTSIPYLLIFAKQKSYTCCALPIASFTMLSSGEISSGYLAATPNGVK